MTDIETVRDSSDLRNKIGQLRVGEAVELKGGTDGRAIAVRTALAAREEEAEKKWYEAVGIMILAMSPCDPAGLVHSVNPPQQK